MSALPDKVKFGHKELAEAISQFFLEGLFAWLLWNGVGHTLLRLPHATYWQILGLTIMVTFILPKAKGICKRLDLLIWNKDGERRP